MTENERLLALISDKILQSERAYMLTHTNFLSLAERSAARACCKEHGAHIHFYGGYPDAERTVLFVLPDYMEADEHFPSEEDEVLCVLSCRTSAGSKALTHRDYLGSLLSLGLEREVIGDILVCENGAGVAFSEEKAKEILLEREIEIIISVGDGDGKATAWGCDLTYDYVKINGDYRT